MAPYESPHNRLMPASAVLMFTIGLNGYGTVYARCLASQQAYANKHGYDYIAVDRPRGLVAPDVSSWVKIPLIRHAFDNGYDWVFFIDADCQVQHDAPPLESVEQEGKSLYMAVGYSGRVNAGVIIAKNTAETRMFLSDVIDNAAFTVPAEDQALYENGHVIHYSKDKPFVHILSSEWNNNCDPGLKDFVRHFSAGGPMRKLYRKSLVGFTAHVTNRVQTKVWKKLRPSGTPSVVLRERIDRLAAQCIQNGFAPEVVAS
jgi:hypothetical protein